MENLFDKLRVFDFIDTAYIPKIFAYPTRTIVIEGIHFLLSLLLLILKQMLQCSKRLLGQLHIGQNETIKVPQFDCGPSDPRNLLMVILEKSVFYEVGCKDGRMINKHTTADSDLVS